MLQGVAESFSRKAWQTPSSSRNQPTTVQICWNTGIHPGWQRLGWFLSSSFYFFSFLNAWLLELWENQLMGQSSQSQSFCLIFQVLRHKAQQVRRKRWNRAVFHSSVSKFLVAISPAPGVGAWRKETAEPKPSLQNCVLGWADTRSGFGFPKAQLEVGWLSEGLGSVPAYHPSLTDHFYCRQEVGNYH